MLSALLAAAAIRPILFPRNPIPEEVLAGEKIYRERKGPERTQLDDRVVIGRWFDGRTKRDVESAIWVSPSLLSRWLGYLNVREKWSLNEMENRYDAVARRLDGQITIIVQLSAFPKLDPLAVDADRLPGVSGLTDVRFLATYRKDRESATGRDHQNSIRVLGRIQPRVTPLASLSAKDWRPLVEPRWYKLTPLLEPLVPEFDQAPFCLYDWVMGDYVTAYYLVEIPVTTELENSEGFSLRIFSKGKERIADFSLMQHR